MKKSRYFRFLLAFLAVWSGCGGAVIGACKLDPALIERVELARGLHFIEPVGCEKEGQSLILRLGRTQPAGADKPDNSSPSGLPSDRLASILRVNLGFEPAGAAASGYSPNGSAAGGDQQNSRSLVEDQMVRGAYSFAEKKLLLAAALSAEEFEKTAAHELVHALQDQHFGIRKLLAPNGPQPAGRDTTFADSDRQLARFSLLEGDAIYSSARIPAESCAPLALAAGITALPTAENPKMGSAPSWTVFRREFANRFGLHFLCRSLSAGNKLDSLFLTPPESTKELLPGAKTADHDTEMFTGMPTGTLTGIPVMKVRLAAQKEAAPNFPFGNIPPATDATDGAVSADRFGAAGLLYLLGTGTLELLGHYQDDAALLFAGKDGRHYARWTIRFSSELAARQAEQRLCQRFCCQTKGPGGAAVSRSGSTVELHSAAEPDCRWRPASAGGG